MPSRPRAMVTLDAMGESVITVDAEGRIDYINHAAETLLSQRFDQVMGKSFAEVASLVDETDRRSLGDPVRKALTTGGRVTMGRRAVLVPAQRGPGTVGGNQRHAAALRRQGHCRLGAGAARYQRAARADAANDLSGQPRCPDRPGESTRVRAAAAGGDGLGADREPRARAVLPGPRPLQSGERHLRPYRRRQHAARGRLAHQRRGARFGYGGTHRRR